MVPAAGPGRLRIIEDPEQLGHRDTPPAHLQRIPMPGAIACHQLPRRHIQHLRPAHRVGPPRGADTVRAAARPSPGAHPGPIAWPRRAGAPPRCGPARRGWHPPPPASRRRSPPASRARAIVDCAAGASGPDDPRPFPHPGRPGADPHGPQEDIRTHHVAPPPRGPPHPTPARNQSHRSAQAPRRDRPSAPGRTTRGANAGTTGSPGAGRPGRWGGV